MDTLFVGQTIVELDQVESTNTYAINLIKEMQVAEGAIICTYNQTKGRGQLGNTWLAERGKNLTFSLILHPGFLRINNQFYLSKIISLAIFGMLTDFLNPSLYDIKIKWPNDILVNNQKIAGVLIENILRANFLQSAVIGVGININQNDFTDVDKEATSLNCLLQQEFNLKDALHIFCRHFEALYLSLKQNKFEKITADYLTSLYGFKKPAIYQADERIFSAEIVNVEENGLLVLHTEENKIEKFNFKEIRLIR